MNAPGEIETALHRDDVIEAGPSFGGHLLGVVCLGGARRDGEPLVLFVEVAEIGLIG